MRLENFKRNDTDYLLRPHNHTCPSLVPVISPKASSLLRLGQLVSVGSGVLVTDSCLLIAKSPVPAEMLSQQCDLDSWGHKWVSKLCSKYHASCYEATGNGERYTSEAVTAQMAPILRQTQQK